MKPDVRHGVTFEERKRRHLVRLTINRGAKLVGKRLTVRVPTTDLDIALMVRDALLDFCLALGLHVTRRPQRRPQRRPSRDGNGGVE